MANVPYDWIDQDIVASTVIQPLEIDSFYNPVSKNHTGYAFDGLYYENGMSSSPAVYASWFTEFLNTPNPYRGSSAEFPNLGLILLSKVALTIIDQSTGQLNLWMQFLIQNLFAFPDNFSSERYPLIGYTPSKVTYADGLVSVTYLPDEGVISIKSPMVVTMDFVQDIVYLDVSVPGQ